MIVNKHRDDDHVFWQDSTVSPADRSRLKKHHGLCVWMCGLSGAGKSTLANTLEEQLFAQGFHTMLLDGDNIRHGLSSDLGFSSKDRTENLRRVAEVSRLMVDAGLIVISAFISPLQSDRNFARGLFQPKEFIEVFVDTPISLCESRDTKGLYKKARAGRLTEFTGIDSPFEQPNSPEIVIHTDQHDPLQAIQELLNLILVRQKL